MQYVMFFFVFVTDAERKMNPSTSNEFSGSTASGGTTGNKSRHATLHTASGSSGRTSSRSVNVTPKHALCTSSAPQGTINSGYFVM